MRAEDRRSPCHGVCGRNGVRGDETGLPDPRAAHRACRAGAGRRDALLRNAEAERVHEARAVARRVERIAAPSLTVDQRSRYDPVAVARSGRRRRGSRHRKRERAHVRAGRRPRRDFVLLPFAGSLRRIVHDGGLGTSVRYFLHASFGRVVQHFFGLLIELSTSAHIAFVASAFDLKGPRCLLPRSGRSVDCWTLQALFDDCL